MRISNCTKPFTIFVLLGGPILSVLDLVGAMVIMFLVMLINYVRSIMLAKSEHPFNNRKSGKLVNVILLSLSEN